MNNSGAYHTAHSDDTSTATGSTPYASFHDTEPTHPSQTSGNRAPVLSYSLGDDDRTATLGSTAGTFSPQRSGKERGNEETQHSITHKSYASNISVRHSKEAPSLTVTIVAYSLPGIAFALLYGLQTNYLNKYFHDSLKIQPTTLALNSALIAGLSVAFLPFCGYLLDQCRFKTGRRRSVILIGAIASAIASVLLFNIPDSVTDAAASSWKIHVYYCVLYATYSIMGNEIYLISKEAFGLELTYLYHQRIKLFGASEMLRMCGYGAGLFLPIVLRHAWGDSKTYSVLSITYGCVFALFAIIFVSVLGENTDLSHLPRHSMAPGVRKTLRNRAFRPLLGGVLSSAVLEVGAIMLPLYTSTVKLPLSQTMLVAVYGGTCLLATPVWTLLALRFGKRTSMVYAQIWKGFAHVVFGIVGTRFSHSKAAVLISTMLLASTVGFRTPYLLGMLADVADYDQLRTNTRREAQLVSMVHLARICGRLPLSFLSILVLNMYGYSPTNILQPDGVSHAMVLLVAVPTAVGSILAAASYWFYPISEEMHRDIRHALMTADISHEVPDPVTGGIVVISEPRQSVLDPETVTWTMDHFSVGELARFLTNGPRALQVEVWSSIGVCFLAAAAALFGGFVFITREHGDAVTSAAASAALTGGSALVMIGCALGAAAAFHCLRVAPQSKLAIIPKAIVFEHAENVQYRGKRIDPSSLQGGGWVISQQTSHKYRAPPGYGVVN